MVLTPPVSHDNARNRLDPRRVVVTCGDCAATVALAFVDRRRISLPDLRAFMHDHATCSFDLRVEIPVQRTT